MGAKTTKIDKILYYYVFQKKINNYLNTYAKRKDRFRLKDGYIICLDWIKEWKMRINYDNLVADYLSHFNLESTKLNDEQEMMINQFIENDSNLDLETKTIIKYSYSVKDDLITQNFLENLVNKKTFEKLEISDPRIFLQVKYIFKEKMLILNFFYKNEKYHLINLTLQFFDVDEYKDISKFFEESQSDKIIDFFCKYKAFEKKYLELKYKDSDKIYFAIKNENYKEILNNINNNQNSQLQENEFFKDSIDNKKIKNLTEINFNLINRVSYRGLDNVGAR